MKKIGMVFSIMLLFVIGLFSVNASGNVKVTDIKIKDKSDTISVVKPVFKNNQVTSNITFNQEGDYVLFDVTLKNNKKTTYKIKSVTDNNAKDNIKITYDYDKSIAPGKTGSLKIKMTYKTKLVDKDINIKNLTITIKDSSNGKDNVIINPSTQDNILQYLSLLVVSSVGLIFVLNKKRVNKALLLVLLLLTSTSTVVLAAETTTIKFTSIDIKVPINSYTITIDPGNGSDLIVEKVKSGDKVGKLPEISKEGYTFVRWKDQNGNTVTEDIIVTENMKITAEFTPNKYNIVFDANGGSGSMDSQEMTYDQSENLKHNTFAATGDREFKEWNTKADGSGTTYKDEAKVKNLSTGNDVTLYAQWLTTTTVERGRDANEKMHIMSDEDAWDDGDPNEVVKGLYRATSLPDGFVPSSDNTISVLGAEFPIYIFMDAEDNMNWYTEAEKIYLNPDSGWLFENFEAVRNAPLFEEIDTSKVTDMSHMFQNVLDLESFDGIAGWDVSNVTNMSSMFMSSGITDSTVLSNWDTSKVTDMRSMFMNCRFTTYNGISNWNVSNVTNMGSMFAGIGISVLDGVGNWDTSNVTNMAGLFDWSNVTNVDVIRNWDVSNVIDMGSMFRHNLNLTSADFLNDWNTSKVEYMRYLFEDCRKLTGTIRILKPLKTAASPLNNGYNDMFKRTAIENGAQLVVNYTSDIADSIDTYIATKSENSNVVKGQLVSFP